MKVSVKKGLSYGTTTGVITTLALLLGLYSASAPRNVILAGILTIAFADAFSDGLGIHISEESENVHPHRTVWESTLATVFTKMILGLSFVVPVVFFTLNTAIVLDVVWGSLVLTVVSYQVARKNEQNTVSMMVEHLGIALMVIVGSLLIGKVIHLLIK